MTLLDDRDALTTVQVHPLISQRWSPRGFDPGHELTREDLVPLLEAARWAPSAGNTQPTRFVVALRGEPLHDRLLQALNPGNQVWADRASALVVLVALEHDEAGKAYPWARHDAGQAAAYLTFQAGVEGLLVHQMAGFDAEAVQAAAGLSAVQRPAVLVAVGVLGGPALEGALAERESAPRRRKTLEELVLPGEVPPAT